MADQSHVPLPRWAYQSDIDKASVILPAWRNHTIPDEALAQVAKAIGERQIGRLGVVGSNAVTAPVIEASYRRFLGAFEAHLTHQRFILGARPGAGDFAVFGQLTQLVQFDPTPMALATDLAPRVSAWVGLMEDQSRSRSSRRRRTGSVWRPRRRRLWPCCAKSPGSMSRS